MRTECKSTNHAYCWPPLMSPLLSPLAFSCRSTTFPRQPCTPAAPRHSCSASADSSSLTHRDGYSLNLSLAAFPSHPYLSDGEKSARLSPPPESSSSASSSATASAALDYARFCGRLKTTPRTGWVRCCVPEAESVADHSWRVSALCLILVGAEVERPGGGRGLR